MLAYSKSTSLDDMNFGRDRKRLEIQPEVRTIVAKLKGLITIIE